MKHFFLLLIVIILQLSAKSAFSTDTLTNNKIIVRIVQHVSKKCALSDSAGQKLTNFLQVYKEKATLCHTMYDHCSYLMKELQESIINNFGKDVYAEFKRITMLIHPVLKDHRNKKKILPGQRGFLISPGAK